MSEHTFKPGDRVRVTEHSTEGRPSVISSHEGVVVERAGGREPIMAGVMVPVEIHLNAIDGTASATLTGVRYYLPARLVLIEERAHEVGWEWGEETYATPEAFREGVKSYLDNELSSLSEAIHTEDDENRLNFSVLVEVFDQDGNIVAPDPNMAKRDALLSRFIFLARRANEGDSGCLGNMLHAADDAAALIGYVEEPEEVEG